VAGDDEPQIPPQAAMQLQQLQQQLQASQAQIQQMTQIIQAKQVENQSHEKIAAMDNQTRLQIAQVQAGLKQAHIGSQHELKQTDHLLKHAETQSKEDIAAQDDQTKRDIALMNAQVKATEDQLWAGVELSKHEQQQTLRKPFEFPDGGQD
jgi:hypothetical protein